MSNKSSHHESHDHPDEPGRKPIHRSWIFWVALVLTFAAILTYVFTLDLAKRPVAPVPQSTPTTVP